MSEATSQLKLVISGEATGATEALESVDKMISRIGENIAKLASKFAEAGSQISRFGSDISESGREISAVSSRITRFGGNVERQASKVSEGMGQMGRSIRETADASGTLSEKLRAGTNALKAQSEATKANTASTRQSVHDNMLAVIAMQMIGGAIMAVGIKGADLFTGAIKSAMDFQAQMSRVGAALKTTGGDTATNLTNLGNLALKLSETSLYSANDISDVMQALAKQGLTYKDIYSGAASATITLAQATDSSLTDTGTVVTDVMHEFNLKGTQLTPVINAISGAMHTANISMTNFYDSMKMAGPMASNLGMSVTDTATAIGDLAQHGIKGSQAGTTLRRMFLNLEPHTKAATAEFKALGLETKDGSNAFFDASGHVKSMGNVISILHTHLAGLNPVQRQAALNTMFGTYALSGMTVIAGTTAKQWAHLQQSMANTSAAAVAAEKVNNLKGHLKELTSTVQTIGMAMASFLIPALDKVVQWLDKLATVFQGLPGPVQKIIFIILGVGSALALVTGALITASATAVFLEPGWVRISESIGKFGAGLVTFATETVPKFIAGLVSMATAEEGAGIAANAMFGIWGLVIAGVIAGVILLITHWQQVTAWVKQNFGIDIPATLHGLMQTFEAVWKGIQTAVITAWNYIKPTIISGVQTVSTYWHTVWPEIQRVFQEVWGIIKPIIGIVLFLWETAFKSFFSVIKAVWKPFWDTVGSVLKLAWDLFTGIIKLAWDVISGIIKVALDLLTGHWKQAWDDFGTLLSSAWGDIERLLSGFLSDAYQFGKNFVLMLAHGIEGAVGAVVNAVSTVAGKIKSFLGFHSPTEDGPASDSDQWAPNFVNMFAGGLSAGAPKIADAMNALAAPMSDAFGGVGSTGNGLASSLVGLDPKRLQIAQTSIKLVAEEQRRWQMASKAGNKAAMDSAHQMADKYRADLQQMGIDTTSFSGTSATLQNTMTAMKTVTDTMTQSISQSYNDMTSSVSTDMSTMGTDSLSTTTDMSSLWNNASTSMSDITASSASRMQTVMTTAFQGIGDIAATSAQRVIASVNNMKGAILSAMTVIRASEASIGINVGGGVGGTSLNSSGTSLALGGIGGGGSAKSTVISIGQIVVPHGDARSIASQLKTQLSRAI